MLFLLFTKFFLLVFLGFLGLEDGLLDVIYWIGNHGVVIHGHLTALHDTSCRAHMSPSQTLSSTDPI